MTKIIISLLLFLMLVISSPGQQYKLKKHVFGSTATATSSTDYKMSNTIGQPTIGKSAKSDNIQYIGFWKNSSLNVQKIYLSSGWNMISSYLTPKNDSLESMFESISSKLTILKNNIGQVFIPSFNFNSIGKWKIEDGYKAFMASPDTLIVIGFPINPESKHIELKTGWNIVSYLRSSPKIISECLTTLTESESLTIAKNNSGQVYIPSFDVNSIGNMLPGQGYQMYLSMPDVLTYPSNSSARTSPVEITPLSKHIFPVFKETGNSAVLLLEINGKNGDEIIIYNNKNEVIGSGVVHRNKASVTIWGDNDRTDEIDGATTDELLIVKYLNVKTGEISELNISNLTDLSSNNIINKLTYRQDAFYFANIITEDNSNYSAMDINPNPASDFIEITLEGKMDNSTLVIFSNHGKQIADLTSNLKMMSGNNIKFNTSDFSSGSYNLVLTYDNGKIMKQLIIVK